MSDEEGELDYGLDALLNEIGHADSDEEPPWQAGLEADTDEDEPSTHHQQQQSSSSSAAPALVGAGRGPRAPVQKASTHCPSMDQLESLSKGAACTSMRCFIS